MDCASVADWQAMVERIDQTKARDLPGEYPRLVETIYQDGRALIPRLSEIAGAVGGGAHELGETFTTAAGISAADSLALVREITTTTLWTRHAQPVTVASACIADLKAVVEVCEPLLEDDPSA